VFPHSGSDLIFECAHQSISRHLESSGDERC
jgi:hypothetical protein